MRVIGGRWLAVTACAALLTACSSVRPWLNTAMQADQLRSMHVNETRDPSLVMAVTISGGGARAAAFGYGVLRELEDHEFDWRGRRLTLLEATDLISAVSGGSIVAAYYAAFGRTGLTRFEHDFLRQDFQQSLLGMMARPAMTGLCRSTATRSAHSPGAMAPVSRPAAVGLAASPAS